MQLAPWRYNLGGQGLKSFGHVFFNIGDQFQFGQEYTISNIPFLRKDELCKTKFIDSQYHDIDSRSFFGRPHTGYDQLIGIAD